MKSAFFFFAFSYSLFFYNKIFAQTESVYKKAILLHFNSVNADTIYIMKCIEIELPSKVGKHNIVELNNVVNDIKGKDKLYAVKLMPIQLNNANIDVVLIDYLIENKNDEGINLANSGSEVFTFRYDAKLNSYKLINRKKDKV